MEKQELRKSIQHILENMSLEDISRASCKLIKRLLGVCWWKDADVVLTYFSMSREVSTEELIPAARKDKKEIGIPRISGKNLIFHRCPCTESGYTIHPYGMKEPKPDRPVVSLARPSETKLLLIVPGLAFDRKKNRLGRGAGYYDRFIRHLRDGPGISLTVIGVCLRKQLVSCVPCERWDEPMDVLITEADLID